MKSEMLMKTTRDEIERIVKEYAIDRSRFFEASKQAYKQITETVEGAFVDKSKRWDAGIHWSNMGHYHPRAACVYRAMNGWAGWMDALRGVIPADDPVYVLFEDCQQYAPKYWVYESYRNELLFMLNEINGLDDVYVVSKKYDWLISLNHHDVISYVEK